MLVWMISCAAPEEYDFFKALPIQVTESMAGAFLHGCKVHGRRDLAKMMAEEIKRMKLKGPGSFVTLSNIYAAEGDWEEVGNLRNVIKERNVHKQPGFSWLEKPGEVHEGRKEKEGKKMASGLDVISQQDKNIVGELGVKNKFVKDLSNRELYSVCELLSKYLIGNNLCVERDVVRLVGIQCYRGIRHVDNSGHGYPKSLRFRTEIVVADYL
ncbi:hypothetical protein VNO80_25545 [Phaseolus coccineus]|uniref:Pentatricopeptide repeat-containing protein n=1 Tax=Phaseolus coccineus TaxID=3886 RepID=A0AAN9QM10_PHACN